jgi:hypothetical protein
MSAAHIPRTVPERKPRAGVISNSHGKGGKSSLTVQTSRAKQSTAPCHQKITICATAPAMRSITRGGGRHTHHCDVVIEKLLPLLARHSRASQWRPRCCCCCQPPPPSVGYDGAARKHGTSDQQERQGLPLMPVYQATGESSDATHLHSARLPSTPSRNLQGASPHRVSW